MWGPYTVDRFVSYYNSKTRRFNSRFWNPGTEGIDAFTVNRSNEVNWVVTPISIILRFILYMRQSKVTGTLVCPKWYSVPYWPLLFPDGFNPIRAVFEVCEIQCYSGVL